MPSNSPIPCSHQRDVLRFNSVPHRPHRLSTRTSDARCKCWVPRSSDRPATIRGSHNLLLKFDSLLEGFTELRETHSYCWFLIKDTAEKQQNGREAQGRRVGRAPGAPLSPGAPLPPGAPSPLEQHLHVSPTRKLSEPCRVGFLQGSWQRD